jgi:hypothetical protein
MRTIPFARFTLIPLSLALAVMTTAAVAQPRWGSESSPVPNAGSGTSQKANEAADRTIYKPIEYTNAARRAPR